MNANLLHNIYQQSLSENERNITFWEGYLQNLKALQLNIYSEKLTMPMLVPLGSRILFRGELKHTNEVTVALGADYFTKCSVSQAEVLRQHRIKDAMSKLELLKKERDFLQNQLPFKTLNETLGHDIIEAYTVEEDEAWRLQHREKVRQYKQQKDKSDETPINEVKDEELWNRLEELELQEELENELSESSVIDTDKGVVLNNIPEFKNTDSIEDCGDNFNDNDNYDDYTDKGIKDTPKVKNSDSDEDDDEEDDDDTENDDEAKEKLKHGAKKSNAIHHEIYTANCRGISDKASNESKFHLLERIMEGHRQVRRLVIDMRASIDSKKARSELELVDRLDEMEKIDELEDEIEILEDMLGSSDESQQNEIETEGPLKAKQQKSVAFANDDDNETLEVTFKHSDVEPANAPYDPEKGIMKPSDVYEACSNFFNAETPSILKKSKYVSPSNKSNNKTEDVGGQVDQDNTLSKTIVIKDIVEKDNHSSNHSENSVRPISLFKKMRKQNKN